MNAMENLLTRRSVRSYKSDMIDRETLNRILKAGTHAATGRNLQAPIIIAVTNREMRDRLSKLNAAVMGADNDPFYGAPCVIVVLADPEMPTWIDDGSLVLGNLMNAASALGLGSCWINRARQTFDMPEGKALLEKWGLPERSRGVGNCILGYADEAPALKERLDGRIIKV